MAFLLDRVTEVTDVCISGLSLHIILEFIWQEAVDSALGFSFHHLGEGTEVETVPQVG